jgi:hypothetical protein
MWEACRVPFVPELFSARALARPEDRWRLDELVAVPYFDGLMAGEPDALGESFAAEPELRDPVRGRVKGARAFGAFVTEMNAWIARRNVRSRMSSMSLPSDAALRSGPTPRW